MEVPRHIASPVPALTEILFAVGAGPQVIAVRSFDRADCHPMTVPDYSVWTGPVLTSENVTDVPVPSE